MFTTHINSLSHSLHDGRPRQTAGGVVVLALIIMAVLAETAFAAAPVKLSAERAERAARTAVAPLHVKDARCVALDVQRKRQRQLCVLEHPSAAGLDCSSWVIVTAPGRASVQSRNVCFPEIVFGGLFD
jgi:hypothetical protein